MDKQDSELLEKVRQQFDFGPYPRVPIETSPKDFPGSLYPHYIGTSYYHRNQKNIDSAGKTILDVGCGTGYTSLVLAEANPGARIIGIDISEKSIELARQRLSFHGFNNSEFYVLSIEEIPTLGRSFDYINCDEVLYLIPAPVQALKIMKSVLKEDGIMRANLHNYTQRHLYYGAQKLFKEFGLMARNPEKQELEIVSAVMESLRDDVILKVRTWTSILKEKQEDQEQAILANYLLQGDRGFTMPELFKILEKADLALVDMVNWRQWDLMNLFKEPDDLPVFLSLILSEATLQEKLLVFNLLHPTHRLLDFWCGHPGIKHKFNPIEEWTDKDWHTCTVHLHPQLRTPKVAEQVIKCLRQHCSFPLGELLAIPGQEAISMESTFMACIIPPLLKSPQSISSLVERWQQIQPVNLETLEPVKDKEVFEVLKDTLTGLEKGGYVFLATTAS